MLLTRTSKLDIYTSKLIVDISLDSIKSDSAKKLSNEAVDKINLDEFSVAKLLSYVESKYQLSPSEMSSLQQTFTEYCFRKSRNNISNSYLNTVMGYKIVEDALNKYGAPLIVDPVKAMFSDFISNNSFNAYSFDTDNIKGFLYNAFTTMFYLGAKADIWSVCERTGYSIETGGSTVRIEDNLVLTDNKPKYDKVLDFKYIVKNIYTASDYLYYYNPESGSRIIYDLWSRYKYSCVKDIANKIKSAFSKVLKGSSSLHIRTDDCNRELSVNATYVNKIMDSREVMLNIIDSKTANFNCPLYKLENLLGEINASFSNSSKKDNMIPLKSNEKRGYNEEDIFLATIYAMSSVKEFNKYLDANGISPFSVPSAIFRDERFLRRFNTLDGYLSFYESTTSLMNVDCITMEGFLDNDAFHQNIVSLDCLMDVKFSSIKDLFLYGKKSTSTSKNLLFTLDRAKLKQYAGILTQIATDSYAEYMRLKGLAEVLNEGGSLGNISTVKNSFGTDIFNFRTCNEFPLELMPYLPELKLSYLVGGIDTGFQLLALDDSELKDRDCFYNCIRYHSLFYTISHILLYVCDFLSNARTAVSVLKTLSDFNSLLEGKSFDVKTFLVKFNVTLCSYDLDNVENLDETLEKYFKVILGMLGDLVEYPKFYYNSLLSHFESNYFVYSDLEAPHSNALKKYSVIIRNKDSRAVELRNLQHDSTYFCDDYLTLGDVPITTKVSDCTYYLHRYGYWVCPTKADFSYFEYSPREV